MPRPTHPYIRLKKEFVYLAVVLDAFSRKVVGWALERTLAARLPIAALEQAIAQRQPPPGLVHHSDRGVQYACEEYAQILQQHQMIPSMSRPANPYDNASCESFMKTLKREEIYANDYRDLEHLLGNIEVFIEQYYNRFRLHSALGYRPPEEFEQEAVPGINGATMSFFRHEEIYIEQTGSLALKCIVAVALCEARYSRGLFAHTPDRDSLRCYVIAIGR